MDNCDPCFIKSCKNCTYRRKKMRNPFTYVTIVWIFIALAFIGLVYYLGFADITNLN